MKKTLGIMTAALAVSLSQAENMEGYLNVTDVALNQDKANQDVIVTYKLSRTAASRPTSCWIFGRTMSPSG